MMTLNEPSVLKVRLHRIFVKKRVRPVRVMVTGDWHISPIVSERQLSFLKEALAEAEPDVIVLQGDIVDSPVELKRETSLEKLMSELKICGAMAPTVMVLGSHDFITPTRRPENMREWALPMWRKICKKCGVQLLVDEWARLPAEFSGKGGLRIFGIFQDEKFILSEKGYGQRGANRKELEARWLERWAGRSVMESGLSNADDELLWATAHAPMLSGEAMRTMSRFDIVSFGHTHGGTVPRGLDEIFARCGWNFGLISADKSQLFPREVRGAFPASESTTAVINPGMIATHFYAPRVVQNMNFLKAAEVSVVEVDEKADEDENSNKPKNKGKTKTGDKRQASGRGAATNKANKADEADKAIVMEGFSNEIRAKKEDDKPKKVTRAKVVLPERESDKSAQKPRKVTYSNIPFFESGKDKIKGE